MSGFRADIWCKTMQIGLLFLKGGVEICMKKVQQAQQTPVHTYVNACENGTVYKWSICRITDVIKGKVINCRLFN